MRIPSLATLASILHPRALIKALSTEELTLRRVVVRSVAGYYKGILHKAGATQDAKAHAREILDKMGVQYEE